MSNSGIDTGCKIILAQMNGICWNYKSSSKITDSLTHLGWIMKAYLALHKHYCSRTSGPVAVLNQECSTLKVQPKLTRLCTYICFVLLPLTMSFVFTQLAIGWPWCICMHPHILFRIVTVIDLFFKALITPGRSDQSGAHWFILHPSWIFWRG